MNEILNNWKKEMKQKIRYWIWNQKVKLHRRITKIRDWCQEKIINLLEKIEDWAHRKLDDIYDNIFDEDLDRFDPIEGDTLG